MGVPYTHPVTGQVMELFYVPRAGPVVELRIRAGRGTEWRSNVMPTQIYADQASDVTEHCKKAHVLKEFPAGALMTHQEFHHEVETARAAQGRRPTVGASSTAPGRTPGPVRQACASQVSWGATLLCLLSNRPCQSAADRRNHLTPRQQLSVWHQHLIRGIWGRGQD